MQGAADWQRARSAARLVSSRLFAALVDRVANVQLEMRGRGFEGCLVLKCRLSIKLCVCMHACVRGFESVEAAGEHNNVTNGDQDDDSVSCAVSLWAAECKESNLCVIFLECLNVDT